MDCSLDMALSFFNKWKEEVTVLTVMLASPRFNLSGAALVSDCSSEGIRLVPPTIKTASGEIISVPGEIIVGFEEASFEYAEPREASSEIRDKAESLFVCVLTIKFPDLVLKLTEMRNQPEFVQS